MVTIEVDPKTAEYLAYHAAVERISTGEAVARLVARVLQMQPDTAGDPPEPVPIHADYAGERIRALFHPGPGGIEITTGDLAGTTYRTPSQAARAVVHSIREEVSANRSGWTFWMVTATGVPLQAIRYHYR